MKRVIIFLIILFSQLKSFSQLTDTTTTISKTRYISIDFATLGFSVGKSIITMPNSFALHAQPISIFYGITKWNNPLFVQAGIDGELRLSFWSLDQYYDLNLRVGYFFLKKEKVEISMSSGVGRITGANIFDAGILSLSSSARVFYKLSKELGAGINYYLNINEITPMSAIRFTLNYSISLKK